MSFTFRPAVRENVPLLIGISGPSGSGKTYSAMRIATGLAAGKKFAVIDTESGRAKSYADSFAFDHGDLKAPFTPERYLEAINAADAAGYPVVVIDSMSHEWAGDGGILDMQEDEFKRMGYKDAAKMASWIKPKMAHKSMVTQLLQVRAHIIMCFRAEAKIEMTRGDNGKMEIHAKKTLTSIDGWIPICEKSLPFELTASFLVTPDRPGVMRAIKLQEQHKAFFPVDVPVTEEAGKGMGAWAVGGAVPVRAEANKPGAGSKAEKIVERLCALGTTREAVLLKIGKESADQIDSFELATLIGWGKEIKEGMWTVEQIFGSAIGDADIPL
jgi:hypothetical protein